MSSLLPARGEVLASRRRLTKALIARMDDPRVDPARAPTGAAPKRIEVSYGSDSATGLICGYVFTPHARSVDSAAATAWLEDGSHDVDSADFIWLHFSGSNSRSEKWLRDHLSLPEHYFETMCEGPGSTRVEQEDDCLLAVINDVIYDFSYDASQIATLWMCVHRNFVITVRLHPLRSVDRLRIAVKGGELFASPVSLLVHLLRDQVDVLQKIQRDAATRVDQIEDSLLAGRVNIKRSTLGSLRRVLVRLCRLLAPDSATLFRLLNRPPAWFAEDDGQELHAATEESSAVLSDLAALQERTKLLQEEIVAQTTEQTNRSVFVLTMVTVLALPINIVAGLLGMNVGGIPLAQDENGFWLVAALVAAFSGLAGWFAFSRQQD